MEFLQFKLLVFIKDNYFEIIVGAGAAWGFYFFFYNWGKSVMQAGDINKQLSATTHLATASLVSRQSYFPSPPQKKTILKFFLNLQNYLVPSSRLICKIVLVKARYKQKGGGCTL